ncbi:MAG: nitroreductase [Nitratireductor sp.]|nr:nitroreductase [Nitratireductor sp.]
MATRRSVPAKTMGGPGPSDMEIDAMARIAARIPDHGKIAPWRFIVYSDAAKARLGERILQRALENDPDLAQDMREIERTRLSRSPTVIGLISAPVRDHPKVPVWEQELSCGAAGLAWLIAANASGYDAQWLTEWIAFDEALAAELGCGAGERIAGFIHIGTRTMPKTERDRPDMAEVLSVME